MVNTKITDMAPDASVGGGEKIAVSDGGNPKAIDVDNIKSYIIAAIESIVAASAIDGDDSIFVKRDGSLKPIDIDDVEQYIADTVWGKSAETNADDADVLLLKDGGSTEKTITCEKLAEYMLAGIEGDILDISDKNAITSPGDSDLVLVVQGTSPKKITWSDLYGQVLNALSGYVTALNGVSSINDADVLYTVQGSQEKKVTLADLKAYIGASIDGSGTAGDLAKWTDSDTLSTMSIVENFTSGSDNGVPTTEAVSERIDKTLSEENDIADDLADNDNMLVYDDSESRQRKSTLSRMWTYIWSKIKGLSSKSAVVDADILTIQDSADSNSGKELTLSNLWGYIWGKIKGLSSKTNPVGGDILTVQDSADNNDGKEVTISNLWSNKYLADAKAIKLDDFTAPDDTTDLDASTSSHGLCPKGDNDATHFLAGDLSWSAPTITNSNMSEAILKVDTVSVTSTEVKSLNTSPKELVSAPGANKVIEFISAVLFLDYGTTDYGTNGDLVIRTTGSQSDVSATITAALFLYSSGDSYRDTHAITSSDLKVNEGLELYCEYGDPASGDSPLTVKITYRVHDFS